MMQRNKAFLNFYDKRPTFMQNLNMPVRKMCVKTEKEGVEKSIDAVMCP